MTDGENLARRFHEIYERLAPSFGYETRADTKAFDPTSANGRLMIAVCSEMLPDAEIMELLRGGDWSAGVFHNPPKRGQPSNSILGAQTLWVRGKFGSKAAAMAAAEAALAIGRIEATFIHSPTARVRVMYTLSTESVNRLGELAQIPSIIERLNEKVGV